MTDFSALSPIKASASAVDPASVTGAGLANLAVFGDILAETLETPTLAAAAPNVAVPPAAAGRQRATGMPLPQGGESLPGDPSQFAGVPEKDRPGETLEPTVRRNAARNGRSVQPSKALPPYPQPVQTARDSAATSKSATASTAGGVAALAEPETQAYGDIEPLVTFAPVAPIAAIPTAPRAFEPSPASARQPVPVAPITDLPIAGEALESLSPRLAGERLSGVAALPTPVERLAAKAPVMSLGPPAPVDQLGPFASSKAGPLPLPAIAVAGPVMRVAMPSVRSKSLAGTEPVPIAIALPASVAARGTEEAAYIAPLAPPVLAGALPTPMETLTTSPATAPTPAATAARQDFVALVERLIDSRNAAAPAPVQAALAHSEFGEIALRFTRDERGLNVAMLSADPDFAPAVQAAMPAERLERTTPEQPRGQPGASLPQGTTEDRGANHAAPQSRSTPERAARLAADPEPGSRDDDRPARRAGIFA